MEPWIIFSSGVRLCLLWVPIIATFHPNFRSVSPIVGTKRDNLNFKSQWCGAPYVFWPRSSNIWLWGMVIFSKIRFYRLSNWVCNGNPVWIFGLRKRLFWFWCFIYYSTKFQLHQSWYIMFILGVLKTSRSNSQRIILPEGIDISWPERVLHLFWAVAVFRLNFTFVS